MPIVDQQLHGYRHGHQLLSASTKLSKTDQELVDRLSDIAGPLRAGEIFDSYLTCYPLPSGLHYVLARTWQDLEAPRAGCVRTRSLIVPMKEWTAGLEIDGLAEALSMSGPTTPAERMEKHSSPRLFRQVDISQGIELVEALFLEDRKPIAVFDAPDPEAITLRLLAAFWPSLRRTFSVSTFALSPRSIGDRSFDLVFAPKNARSRFSDWPGRRIDGRKPASSRHRWSNEIATRVFAVDPPSLLPDDTPIEFASETGGSEAELRISLLWDELRDKLETSPNAALGLLDIANSRSIQSIDAIRLLEPALGRAAQLAAASQPPIEAWRFLHALTDKLRNVRISASVAKTIRSAAIQLAVKAPVEAIENVPVFSTSHDNKLLLGAVGDGIAQAFDKECAEAVLKLDPANILQLLLLSPSVAEVSLSRFPELSAPLAMALATAPLQLQFDAQRQLLHLLVEDNHADAARLLIANLDREGLIAEVRLLHAANALAAASLHIAIADRASTIGVTSELCDAVAKLPVGPGPDALLYRLIGKDLDGLAWLLDTTVIADQRRVGMVSSVLRCASIEEFNAIASGTLAEVVLQWLTRDIDGNLDLIERILEDGSVEPVAAIATTVQILPRVESGRARALAAGALDIILPRDTGRGRAATLDTLLDTIGSKLDGPVAVRLGLKREVPSELVTENLAAFNRATPGARQRILIAIEELAAAIIARGRIDFPESAAADAASLLWDSAHVDKRAFIRASAALMPFLLRSRREPASPLIAAAFPSVYQELKKHNDAPDFLKFFVFVDWDKCKTARSDLVEAFMKSNWRATDIALAAARAGDVGRILGRIASEDDGLRAIKDIQRNLFEIPDPWRGQVYAVLQDKRSAKPL
ncbi:hypothetical protein MesoLj113c_29960 [Mesorhizobium sp. 113-3-9]|uniref:GAP1-N1 domain-containing protein n=1 Tax=Mesorhizobium sp. 113-3-9 TaxID=2744517 RepID=UPI00192946AB|nr:hypothetical protein [Mesorhizobium sp. 113-3-9]BCG86886.1 hypothetical protein MesoLj113c_29960 [Mesorhizobium sp. 113-3-9]